MGTVLVWATNILLAALLAAGFAIVVLRFRRLENLQKKWHRELADLVVAVGADAIRRAVLASPRYADPRCLSQHGGKIYSQNDEDGIIAEIFRRIGTSSRRFLEIGIGDGLENNTLALLLQGWSGTWIDGSAENARRIRARFAPLLADGRLKFIEAFVARGNIASLLGEAHGTDDLDFFSLDIDGNDYHILAAIPLRARVVALEYNAKFPPPIEWAVKYDESRAWNGTDQFGASLASFARLLAEKGYSLVGCNLSGINAFFVRNDLLGKDLFLEPFTAERHYEPARYWMGAGFPSGHKSDYRPD